MTNIIVQDIGRFEVIENHGGEYPGVDVEFIPNDGDNVGYTYPRIMFERPVEGKLRLLVWFDPSSEDYSHKFEWDI